MSQPTQTEVALEEFRQAGVVTKSPRLFSSKRMTGFNAEVYSSWIERWARNFSANYPVIKGSAGVSFLKNSALGVPAVVVGIGPSLDDEINDLKTASRHAVIIATDAALRPLVRHGIQPDVVLNFDARDEQRTMWQSIDTSKFVLVANSCTSPMTIAAWQGPIMFFNMLQSDDEFCMNILPAVHPYIGQLPNMGTVGNGAVFLAHLMGCKPILTVGMDLCYSCDENIHKVTMNGEGIKDRGPVWRYRCKDWRFTPPTQDLPEGEWTEIENKVLYDNDDRLKDTFDEKIKDKTYKVDKALQMYRNSLISNVGQMDIQIINCSGGVMENFVPSMPLRQALERHCYSALEPARAAVKFMRKIVPAANLDWFLDEEARIFVPTDNASWSSLLRKSQ